MPASRRVPVLLNLLLIAGLAGVIVALTVTDVRRIGRNQTGDFVHFYQAAAAMASGQDPYAAGTRGYIYPPLLAFLFQPLSMVSQASAAGIMLPVNVLVTLIAVGISGWGFAEKIARLDKPLAGTVVLSITLLALLMNCDKVKGEWQMWQTDVFMLLLFVLGYRWLSTRPVLAGAMLGIAVNIKYLPVLFLPYLLVRRRFVAAASLVLFSILFALLPAVSTGWNNNIDHWRTASAGLVGMIGETPKQNSSAEIHSVSDELSCSITSAIARKTADTPMADHALSISAGFAAILFFIVALLYQFRGLSVLGPKKKDVTPCDWKLIESVEWSVLVAVFLAFSPQTNTRHLFDALLLTIPASAILLFAPRKLNRIPLILGCIVLIAGFMLPPGNRNSARSWQNSAAWLKVAGPCWCMLAMSLTLLWTSLSLACATDSKSGRPQSRGLEQKPPL